MWADGLILVWTNLSSWRCWVNSCSVKKWCLWHPNLLPPLMLLQTTLFPMTLRPVVRLRVYFSMEKRHSLNFQLKPHCTWKLSLQMLCLFVSFRSTQDRSPAKERGQKAWKDGEVSAKERDGGEEEADAVPVWGESDPPEGLLLLSCFSV